MTTPVRRRLAAMTLAASLAVSFLTPLAASDADAAPSGPGAAVTDRIATPALTWTPCDEGVDCATVTVPLDHDEPRGATIDLALYIVFFLPGIVALTWAGWTFANESLAIREQTFNADPLPVYPFKFIVPIAGAVLLLQGLVEIARCVICLRTGAWPARDEDVEEVDLDKLKEMVHVKDEDIEALDKYVTPAGGKP